MRSQNYFGRCSFIYVCILRRAGPSITGFLSIILVLFAFPLIDWEKQLAIRCRYYYGAAFMYLHVSWGLCLTKLCWRWWQISVGDSIHGSADLPVICIFAKIVLLLTVSVIAKARRSGILIVVLADSGTSELSRRTDPFYVHAGRQHVEHWVESPHYWWSSARKKL